MTATQFPGEGRGPVAKVQTAIRNARILPFRDWAPASAGKLVGSKPA